jgi:hypothetical protein
MREGEGTLMVRAWVGRLQALRVLLILNGHGGTPQNA